MRKIRRLERLTVTDPITGRTYPVPAGGADDDVDDPDDAPEGDDDPDDDELDVERAKAKIAKANSEAANLRRRLKEAEAKAAKLDELEEAQKTEAQKAAERLTAAEKQAREASSSALKLEVALDKAPDGMAPAQIRKLAKRLSGEDREALEADADELFAEFAPAPDDEDDGIARRPRERLRRGATPGGEPEETDPRKLAARLPRR